MKKMTHIIIFNPDQMRSDCLAHMGENPAAQTPFLDKLSQEEAVSYKYAYCQNPVCVPSRCSFLTGLYPHVRGHRTMRYMLQSNESSILSELKDAGYHVWMNARNDFLPGQEPEAFDRHTSEIFYGGDAAVSAVPERIKPRGELGNKDYFSHYKGRLKNDSTCRSYSSDDEIIDAAIHRINNRPLDKPLCMFLGLSYPHPPYAVEEPYFSAIDRTKLPPRVKEPANFEPKIEGLIRKEQGMQNYTEDDWNELRACYAAMCLKVDRQFEQLCNALKAAGIYDDSAIFFFSDHGDYQGQFGLSEKNQNTFEEGLVRVPFLIKPPKGYSIDPGISESLVELVDFYSTAMAFANVQPNHTHFGKDLTASIADRSLFVREFACCEGGRLAGEIHCNESHAANPNGANPANEYYPRMKAQEDDVAHTKATMLRTERYKYIRRLYESDQLFDMKNDHCEQQNLIDVPKYQSLLAELRLKMLDWYQATCDTVPFTYDSRFSGEMIWARLKHKYPIEAKEQIMALAEKNIPMYEIIKMAKEKFSD